MNNKIKTKYLIQAFTFAFMCLVCAGPVSASEITADNVIKFVNQAREEQGLAILKENDKLIKAAQDKLNDMIKNDYFAHTSPRGVTPWFWFEKNGYDYRYAGENLALSFQTAEDQHKAWMESATHRKNILSSNYQEIGVAVGIEKVNGEKSIVTVQEFGTVAGAVQASRGVSPNGENNLIKESEKNIPQVLTAKKIASNNPEKVSAENLGKNNLSLIDTVIAISVFVLALSLTLVPAAFMAKAFDKIIIIRETDKQNSMNTA